MPLICGQCGIERNILPHGKRQPSLFCQPCSVAIYNATRPPKKTKAERALLVADWYQRNKKFADGYTKEWRREKRMKLIAKFGGKCAHCGIDNPILLDFDHIDDDGYKDSRKNIVFRVQQEPNRFQLLCKNCNWLKEYGRRNSHAIQISQPS